MYGVVFTTSVFTTCVFTTNVFTTSVGVRSSVYGLGCWDETEMPVCRV